MGLHWIYTDLLILFLCNSCLLILSGVWVQWPLSTVTIYPCKKSVDCCARHQRQRICTWLPRSHSWFGFTTMSQSILWSTVIRCGILCLEAMDSMIQPLQNFKGRYLEELARKVINNKEDSKVPTRGKEQPWPSIPVFCRSWLLVPELGSGGGEVLYPQLLKCLESHGGKASTAKMLPERRTPTTSPGWGPTSPAWWPGQSCPSISVFKLKK